MQGSVVSGATISGLTCSKSTSSSIPCVVQEPGYVIFNMIPGLVWDSGCYFNISWPSDVSGFTSGSSTLTGGVGISGYGTSITTSTTSNACN